jgi:hypothetical protein
VQFLFDASGSYYSSLTYGLAGMALTTAAQRTRSATLLAITLTAGIFLGLGLSFAVTPTLTAIPASALG